MQIIPALESGGAELGTVQVAEALTAAGHRALVVSRGGRMETPIVACGAELIRLDVASKNPIAIIANGFKLAALARKERVDVLHVRSRAPSWSTLIASKLTGIPYIGTYHTIYREQSGLKNLYNSGVVRGARVIAVGDETAAVIRQRYAIPDARTVTIHRAVDLTIFDPAAVTAARKAALATAWGLAEGAEVVLLPGRLVHRKGHHVLIRAIHRLVEGGRDNLVGICAGDDQGRSRYHDEMVALVGNLGLNDHVRFIGHCEDMPAAYALSRVAVSAAVESEGLQRAILEAQAMGVPVVVSDVGSGTEVVRATPRVPESEITGYNVQAGDPEALAEAIDRVLRLAPDDYAALSRRASTWVRGSFSHDIFTSKTLALYREVVAEACAGGPAGKQKA
ncbi:glycosyltransferase [Blastochloris viridis]|nr:glycosyltransferase [Blastochloris viridis]